MQAYNGGKASAEDVGIKVLDPHTLEVKLHSPVVYFDSLVTFVTYSPVSKAAVEKFGDQYALEKDTILYSGPYVISDWVPNSSFTLVRNEHFYKQYPVDRYEIKMINKPEAALNAYENNEIDWTGITAEMLSKYKRFSRINKIHKWSSMVCRI